MTFTSQLWAGPQPISLPLRTAEDEMVRWRRWLNGHESEQTPGDSGGQGGLMCCSPWGRKESDTTERLNNNSNNWVSASGQWRSVTWVGEALLISFLGALDCISAASVQWGHHHVYLAEGISWRYLGRTSHKYSSENSRVPCFPCSNFRLGQILWLSHLCKTPGHLLLVAFQVAVVVLKNHLPVQEAKRHAFSPWVRKIPWRRAWPPTPVFLPGESHGQRTLTGYGP